MNPPVRLLHIPKTAGTTISSALLMKFGRRHSFPFMGCPTTDRGRLLALTPERRRAIRLFYGHSYFETGVEEADQAQIITFLREPVDRVISFINHASERKEKYLPDSAPAERFTVGAFLDTGNPELMNLQTKVLTNLNDRELEELGETAAFELARKRLFENVTVFGVQARFDESWVAIWRALHQRPPIYLHLRRANKAAKLQLTPDEVERVRSMNRIDLMLYEAAEAEFERRHGNDTALRRECQAFKARQRRFGPLYSAAWSLAKRIRRFLR